eukprot:gene15055-16608_t
MEKEKQEMCSKESKEASKYSKALKMNRIGPGPTQSQFEFRTNSLGKRGNLCEEASSAQQNSKQLRQKAKSDNTSSRSQQQSSVRTFLSLIRLGIHQIPQGVLLRDNKKSIILLDKRLAATTTYVSAMTQKWEYDSDSGIKLSPQVKSLLHGDDSGDNHNGEIATRQRSRSVVKRLVLLGPQQWPTAEADLLLKVEDCMFPVHRMVLWKSSGLLRSILETVTLTSSEEFHMITLQGVNPRDVEDILPYFYNQHYPIHDVNVFELLRIAEFFEASTVLQRCEVFFVFTKDLHPIDLLKIAAKFRLSNLEANAIEFAAKLPRILQYSDFDDLDLATQHEILTRIAQREEQKNKDRCNTI